MKTILKIILLFFCLVNFSCNKSDSSQNQSCSISDFPSGVSTAPPLNYYVGSTTDATGTLLTSTGQISGQIAASGCGPFGIWEGGNGGEVATELEFRLTARTGVFAMAEGVVTNIQTSSSPGESGEVEGIWVRYGSSYTIKYVHVVNPTVQVGDHVTSGQRLGVSLSMGGGQYFLENEVRQRSGGTTYALAWSSMLTNSTVFNSLYGVGNCGSGTFKGTDGTTTVSTANWLNSSLPSGRWDVSGTDQSCAFN